MERKSKEIINKETEGLNNTLDQIDLTDKYTKVHPIIADYVLLKHT